MTQKSGATWFSKNCARLECTKRSRKESTGQQQWDQWIEMTVCRWVVCNGHPG